MEVHSKETIANITWMMEAGLSNRQIAEQLDVTEGTISGIRYRHFRKTPNQPSRGYHRWEGKRAEEFARLWEDGEPLTEMGDRYGISYSAISHIAHRLGLRRRASGGGGITQAQRDLVVKLRHETDLTITKIAAQADMSYGAAWKILRKT